ncbi:hypothetical protein SAMN04488528_103428 [Clostridium frigidicarnis]|uniref:Uncharacterized protein n=1 Tax=Clostridium frigidicarnis TaxID=84698 RepID=A0A1I1ADX4_9CLOT|nr:hypothetical protein SAMN04488528_103428 [Clostridium frigidicarnis]
MNWIFLYLILLLLIIFILGNILFSIYKNAPAKLKFITSILLVMLILRYVSLILMFILQNVQNIYTLRLAVSLNLISIPCVLLLSYYIFLRRDGLKINFMFSILVSLSLLYFVVMKFVPISFKIHKVYGYLMNYSLNGWIEITYILILSLILMFCIVSYGSKGSISSGIIMVMVSVMLLIGESTLILLGFNVDHNTLIGEFMSLLVLNYALGTLKKV